MADLSLAPLLRSGIVCDTAIPDETECKTMPIPSPLRTAKLAMLDVQPGDKRGFFILLQAPEDAGHYVYGNLQRMPNAGHMAQYASLKMSRYKKRLPVGASGR